jgi:hypothetical protein
MRGRYVRRNIHHRAAAGSVPTPAYRELARVFSGRQDTVTLSGKIADLSSWPLEGAHAAAVVWRHVTWLSARHCSLREAQRHQAEALLVMAVTVANIQASKMKSFLVS